MRVAHRVALDIAFDYVNISPAPNALKLLGRLGPLNIRALCQDGLIVASGFPIVVPESYRKYKGAGGSEWVFISGQVVDSKPQGFVRCLEAEYGTIYEGAWESG